MRWLNVLVIFRREVRDQIRDRRTLFMIFVLPILLYPMLGIGTAKVSELLRDTPRVAVVVGAENLPEYGYHLRAPAIVAGVAVEGVGLTTGPPPLLNPSGDGFNPSLFDNPADAARLRVRAVESGSRFGQPGAPTGLAEIGRGGRRGDDPFGPGQPASRAGKDRDPDLLQQRR